LKLGLGLPLPGRCVLSGLVPIHAPGSLATALLIWLQSNCIFVSFPSKVLLRGPHAQISAASLHVQEVKPLERSSYAFEIRFAEGTEHCYPHFTSSRRSSVTIVTEPDERVSIPGRDRESTFLHHIGGLWGPPSLLCNGYCGDKATESWSWPLTSIKCRG